MLILIIRKTPYPAFYIGWKMSEARAAARFLLFSSEYLKSRVSKKVNFDVFGLLFKRLAAVFLSFIQTT